MQGTVALAHELGDTIVSGAVWFQLHIPALNACGDLVSFLQELIEWIFGSDVENHSLNKLQGLGLEEVKPIFGMSKWDSCCIDSMFNFIVAPSKF